MLKISELHKSVPEGKKLLNGISFDIAKGEFVGILGPSGAGKSLTLRCVIGLTKPDNGTVVLDNNEGVHFNMTSSRGKTLRQARHRIGMIFQGIYLVKRLTVIQNVMLGRLGRINSIRSWLYGFTDEEFFAAKSLLEQLELDHLANRIAGTLSGGEQQRIAVARALFQEPLIILADEPVGSLDPKNAKAIMKQLSIISHKIPVLGVFHQPDLTERYCTRVIGIKEGSVVYNGNPSVSRQELKDLYGDELEHLEHKKPFIYPESPLSQNSDSALMAQG